jgi:hypothetical protein
MTQIFNIHYEEDQTTTPGQMLDQAAKKLTDLYVDMWNPCWKNLYTRLSYQMCHTSHVGSFLVFSTNITGFTCITLASICPMWSPPHRLGSSEFLQQTLFKIIHVFPQFSFPVACFPGVNSATFTGDTAHAVSHTVRTPIWSCSYHWTLEGTSGFERGLDAVSIDNTSEFLQYSLRIP